MEVCILWPPLPISSTPPTATPGNHQSTPCFWAYFFLDSTNKLDHTGFVFICQTYFTKHNALKVHQCIDAIHKRQVFHPFYGWIIFHSVWVCVCVYIYTHIHTHSTSFFMHSSFDGHLGCFPVLATVREFLIFYVSLKLHKQKGENVLFRKNKQ